MLFVVSCCSSVSRTAATRKETIWPPQWPWLRYLCGCSSSVNGYSKFC